MAGLAALEAQESEACDLASEQRRRNVGEVESLPEPLSPKEQRRLIEVVEREAPNLVSVARDAVNVRWLSDDEVVALKGVLLDVFLRSLDRHDEPDAEGAEADRLSGRVELQGRAYRQ